MIDFAVRRAVGRWDRQAEDPAKCWWGIRTEYHVARLCCKVGVGRWDRQRGGIGSGVGVRLVGHPCRARSLQEESGPGVMHDLVVRWAWGGGIGKTDSDLVGHPFRDRNLAEDPSSVGQES